jgi:peroxisomal 2,4-dienoyl-CoA reductase
LFRGKLALVTGGGSGIGKGIATAFARHGASVIILGRNKERLEQAAKEIAAETGHHPTTVPADVRQPAVLKEALTPVVERLGGKLDILVNSAAGNFLAPISKLSTNAFKTVVEIDLLGTFNVTKTCQDWLIKAKGNIINISATLQYRGTPLQAHPSAAKAGIDALTLSLATEWGVYGVRCNAIAPGPIDSTEGMSRLLPDVARQQALREIPLQRWGTVRDIEHAALYLASPAAAWVTGSILVVDGGQWLTSSFFGYPDTVTGEFGPKL